MKNETVPFSTGNKLFPYSGLKRTRSMVIGTHAYTNIDQDLKVSSFILNEISEKISVGRKIKKIAIKESS